MSFKKRCESVADQIGVTVDFFKDSHQQEPFEDDGNLHIVRNGLRACFDVGNGQSNTGKKQNVLSEHILAALGIKSYIRNRVLVEEDDEED